MESTDFRNPTPLRIGEVTADCPVCGSALFVRAPGNRTGPIQRLRCASCGAETAYATLLERISSTVSERAQRVLAESRTIRRVMDREVMPDIPDSTPTEQFIYRIAKNARQIAIALMRGERLEFRVVNDAYAAIRPGVRFLGRTYRDLFPESAALGAEAKMREVIHTARAWYIDEYKTPIPGREGPTWWEGECLPIASGGAEIDSVLVVNWEITERKLAERAMHEALAAVEAAKNPRGS